MGCSQSSSSQSVYQQRPIVSTPNYNNQNTIFYKMQNTPRPKSLNPQSLSANQIMVPSNSQIGTPGTYWNFAHFCCRWDAFQCLQYIMKRVYSQNYTTYYSLVSQKTIQGFTALHVAIQWNSINCFHLLFNNGWLDLTHRDNANNDVFSKAILFKRTQMAQILEKFRSSKTLMVLLQVDQLRGYKTFSQMAASGGQIQPRTQFRINNQRIAYIIDTHNRNNRPPPPFQQNPQQKINQQKEIQNKMKNLQKMENSKSLGQGQESSQINQILKRRQEQKKLRQAQDKIKKQKAEQLKRNIQKQKIQEEIRIKSQLRQQQAKFIEFQKIELQRIQRQKQVMRKNIQAMVSTKVDQRIQKTQNKMICPQDIKEKYQSALAKGTKFIDSQFPPQKSSLGDVSKFKFGWDNCVWLRPDQILGKEYEVFDGISPDDVKQGALSICYYLALLSSISQNQRRIKKIFRFYDKQLGFYAIQLYIEGKPKTIIVDDFIPCLNGRNQPLFAKPQGKQCWVMILEKAWVKMFGNYLASQFFSPISMYQNVLPSPCRTFIIDISKIDQMFDQIVQLDKKNYIMSASSTIQGKQNVQGMVANHEYSLIGAYNINGTKIVKVRNPWGTTQFSGMYSEQSCLWTPQLMKNVGFKKSQDGLFFLNPIQLQNLLSSITVSYYRDDYDYSWMQITSRSDQQIFLMITVKKKGELAMKLTQQNQRFRKNMEDQNTRILFEIYKIGNQYNAQLFSQGQPSTSYGGITVLYSNQKMYQTYEPGKYLIRLKVYYDRAQKVSTRGTLRKFIRGTDGKNPLKVVSGTSVFSIYGPQQYVIHKISFQQAYKYLKNAFRHQILTSPKTKVNLTSVDQDLKTQVISKSIQMKHQVIHYAQNLFPNNQITFTMNFKSQKFRNVSYAFNVDKEKQKAQWILQPNGGWNLCTFQVDFSYQDLATVAQMNQNFKIIR